MKKTGLVLAVALGLFVMLTITAGTAFATKWVDVPETMQGRSAYSDCYIDADSAVKQGGYLIFWTMSVFKPHGSGNYLGGTYNGVQIAKMAIKFEVDLRTPRKIRYLLLVDFDVNDRQIAGPLNPPSDKAVWNSLTGPLDSIVNFVLPLAKEGQDTGAIPAPTSDHY